MFIFLLYLVLYFVINSLSGNFIFVSGIISGIEYILNCTSYVCYNTSTSFLANPAAKVWSDLNLIEFNSSTFMALVGSFFCYLFILDCLNFLYKIAIFVMFIELILYVIKIWSIPAWIITLASFIISSTLSSLFVTLLWDKCLFLQK